MKPKGTFSIAEYLNDSGSLSYRVTGTKVDGERVRRNFSGNHALALARAEKSALETEALNNGEKLRSTWLSAEQLQIAEAAFGKVKEPAELLRAAEYWNEHGRALAVTDAKTVAEAATAFEKWLEKNERLRVRTKGNLKVRVKKFALSFGLYNGTHSEIPRRPLQGECGHPQQRQDCRLPLLFMVHRPAPQMAAVQSLPRG
jgi:hypothetical protein